MAKKSNGEIKPKSKRGGRRAGAGRKSSQAKVVRHDVSALVNGGDAVEVDLDAIFKAHAPRCVANLVALANGGVEVLVERKYQPAGVLVVKGPLRDANGNLERDAKGNPIVVEVPQFPGVPPDRDVLVETKVMVAGPDLKANQYIVDRVLGRPRQAIEVKESGTVRDALAEAEARADSHIPDSRPDGAAP